MDDKPKKLISPLCFIISFLITAIICFGTIWLVHNVWRIVAAVTGDNQLMDIFKQLKEASIMPPILIAVPAAAVMGFVMSITRKKRALMVVLTILLVLLTTALVVVFTEVNRIPIYTVITILSNIMKSGVL